MLSRAQPGLAAQPRPPPAERHRFEADVGRQTSVATTMCQTEHGDGGSESEMVGSDEADEQAEDFALGALALKAPTPNKGASPKDDGDDSDDMVFGDDDDLDNY